MPSGKTHDAITIILAAPVFGATFLATRDVWLSTVAAVGFLFGGFMFGPDLDTASKQYARWKIFKLLWFPYRAFFKHRSRWSHGLVFGTLIRVVYFMGVATCMAFLCTYVFTIFTGAGQPVLWDFPRIWVRLRQLSDIAVGPYGLLGLFVGMWLGAASHTFTDLAGSYVKTGRVTEFL
ncbi:MAG TPA: metal-binding protein [Pyrinomonadaceae bacterium]|nr:metal-binding protein [Pyrinomonadaceae bacterium]